MKNRKVLNILLLCIAVLSLIASYSGVFTQHGPGPHTFKTLHGEEVTIYGKGIYQNDSSSAAHQGIAQDVVTLFLGIPLLLMSWYMARRGSMKGRLLLTGTLAYFLYSYTLYTFFAQFNPFFLVYVALMSLCFFAFILMMMSFNIEAVKQHFSDRLPVKFIGGFLIFNAFTFAMLWMGRIIPPTLQGTAPLGLEHYTTMTVQAMDLGFLIPSVILAGILLIKKNPWGYLLSSIMIMKLITMMTALLAMVIGLIMAGEDTGPAVVIIVPLFGLITVYCLFKLLKDIKEDIPEAKEAV